MIKIYIATPYTRGDVAINVHNACRMFQYLAGAGVHPHNPLLTHFQHLLFPRPYEWWLQYDLEVMKDCDAVLRCAGQSNGADKEVDVALSIGMPVHYFNGFDAESLNRLDDWILWLKENEKKIKNLT